MYLPNVVNISIFINKTAFLEIFIVLENYLKTNVQMICVHASYYQPINNM
jgi:hypothetical protein